MKIKKKITKRDLQCFVRIVDLKLWTHGVVGLLKNNVDQRTNEITVIQNIVSRYVFSML